MRRHPLILGCHVAALLLFSCPPLAAVAGAVPVLAPALPVRDAELSPEALSFTVAAQTASMNLRFEDARNLAAKAEVLDPRHPLPYVVDLAVRLGEIQELLQADAESEARYKEFYALDEKIISMAKERELAYPERYEPKLHLGAAIGCRGLVKLYQSHYLQSYKDGNQGVAYLKQAVALDKDAYDAYLGLGQFEYYCARLNGVLAFFLALKGDEKKGIEMLKTCEAKGSFSAVAARAFLSNILILDQKDGPAALPYIERMTHDYPQSYHHWRYAMAYAHQQGMKDPKSRELVEAAAKLWDSGWRPPAYVKQLYLENNRLDLAKAYMAEGHINQAEPHLKALALSKDEGLAREANGLLGMSK